MEMNLHTIPDLTVLVYSKHTDGVSSVEAVNNF